MEEGHAIVSARGDWRQQTREQAIAHFRQAWAMAPEAGRAALLAAAARGRVGHQWESGRRACVLALLAGPALRSSEPVKAGAYRLFGCEVTDDLPVTWDGGGVTLAELLESVGAQVPARRKHGIGALRPVFR